MRADGGSGWQALLEGAAKGEPAPREGYEFRPGCQMCEKPYVEEADVVIQFFGADLAAAIPLHVADGLAAKLGLSPSESGPNRQRALERLVAARTKERDARFAAIREQLAQEGVEGVMAACVRCHNCMTTCPICYCKTCLFKSPTFDHEPMQYMNWARRKGAYRLPADTMLFHLTRLNHMVLSCIGCGVCSDACPADLPVADLFRAIGQQVQAVFEYEPGRSVEDTLPLITFREDEWSEVGEER